MVGLALDCIGLEGRVGRHAAGLGSKTANKPELTLVGFILVPPRRPRRPIDSPYCGRGPSCKESVAQLVTGTTHTEQLNATEHS